MFAVSRPEAKLAWEGDHEGLHHRVTNFFGDARVPSDEPQAFLIEATPQTPDPDPDARLTMFPPHFHLVRQFQVIVDGDDTRIGTDEVGSFDFHYTDPSTPYGPITSKSGGVTFFTLRPRSDTGSYRMPGSREKMTARAGRNVVVPAGSRLGSGAPSSLELIEPHADGLAGYLLTLSAHETLLGPDPADTGGQYQLVARGSVLDGETELPPLSLIWVSADEAPLPLTAGPGGAEILVLQFPVGVPAAELGIGTVASSVMT